MAKNNSTESAPVFTVTQPIAFSARYCFGGSADKQAVPVVLVPYGHKAPDGTVAGADTLIATRGESLGGKPNGSEGWIAIERLTAGDAGLIVYAVRGGRTEKAAEKAIASYLGDAVARMTDAEFEAFAEAEAQREMQKAKEALLARRMAFQR